jgi:hypothetical protein
MNFQNGFWDSVIFFDYRVFYRRDRPIGAGEIMEDRGIIEVQQVMDLYDRTINGNGKRTNFNLKKGCPTEP